MLKAHKPRGKLNISQNPLCLRVVFFFFQSRTKRKSERGLTFSKPGKSNTGIQVINFSWQQGKKGLVLVICHRILKQVYGKEQSFLEKSSIHRDNRKLICQTVYKYCINVVWNCLSPNEQNSPFYLQFGCLACWIENAQSWHIRWSQGRQLCQDCHRLLCTVILLYIDE